MPKFKRRLKKITGKAMIHTLVGAWVYGKITDEQFWDAITIINEAVNVKNKEKA